MKNKQVMTRLPFWRGFDLKKLEPLPFTSVNGDILVRKPRHILKNRYYEKHQVKHL